MGRCGHAHRHQGGVTQSACPPLVMPGLDPGIHRKTLRSKRMDCRVKCSARGHSRHLFGDIPDTSSLRGFGNKGAHPCRGERYRLWTSGVSLFDWQSRRARTGGSCAVGSGSTPIRATSGLPAGLAATGTFAIARAGRIRARAQRCDNGSFGVEGKGRTSGLGCAQDRALSRTRGGGAARTFDRARDSAAARPRGCAGRFATGLAAL